LDLKQRRADILSSPRALEKKMAMTRDEAWKQLCAWTETDSLRKHARAVEIVMRAAAHRYGGGRDDEELWGIAGMLHDADYEKWPDEHPKRIVAWLRDRGEETIAHAISAHYTKWGVAYETTLDKALLACDEVTGFIGACCLVRPDGIASLTAKSVRKKLKDKAFAAKVDRGEVTAGAGLLEVDLGEHIAFIIEALQPHARELGLTGRTNPA
jgi:predicted hydrolase (HD superfamily)